MQDIKFHQKTLFRSENKLDWASRESWIRRAVFWKYMAMGLESKQRCTNEPLKIVYESALHADLRESPDLEAIRRINSIAAPAFNNRNKKPKSNIEVVKG